MRVRPLSGLIAAALLVGAATAGTAALRLSAAEASVAIPPSAAVPLPTSWAPVAVADRLQPWLAQRLTTAGPGEQLRVMVSGETLAHAQAAAATAGLQVQQEWSKIGIVVGFGTPAQVRSVVGLPGVRNVSGDQPLAPALDTAHRATRSDQAYAGLRDSNGDLIDGRGVSIAVIDSGIDGTHPFFQKDSQSKVVVNRKNVCGSTPASSVVTREACFETVPGNDSDTISGGGHGTHVAGIAAGYEVTTTSPAGIKLRGAAPGAKLVGLSVGAAIGLVDAVSAMNWVIDHQRKPCATAA